MNFWSVYHRENTLYEANTLEEAIEAYRKALIAELQLETGNLSIGGGGPVNVAPDIAQKIRERRSQ
jgi:hypothetical protein